jgi:uncharacterized phage-like protein YoqJ
MKRKNMTKFDKAVSAAFTGHRFYNFSQQEVIKERLTKAILVAYEHGISNFISGFAIGIDLMAAQIVQSLKPSCPGMTLTAAIPFRGQADRFKPGDRMVYDGLMASADEVIILSEYYYTRCFLTETSSWLRMHPSSLPSMMGERRVEPTTLSRKPTVWAFRL